MERYFTPVHGSSEDEVKIYKHSHQPHQQSHNHHYHHDHYQHHGSHSYSSSSSLGKHSDRLTHHHQDNQHHAYHHAHPKVSEEHHNFNKRSSSSLSSSSSNTSSASWTSEPSLDDEKYLMQKPQHSLSCSNITEVQRKSHSRESEVYFDHTDQKHRHSLENSVKLLSASQHGNRMSKLSRAHSKSEEGLQQNQNTDCFSAASEHMDHGPLYKTASLGQSLACNGNVNNTLGGRAVPKKAVSTIHLPSKGILKNKDEGQKGGNFRKAKSMEVLSTRVQDTETSKQITMESARDNFVKGKLQFSAFLDEITKQVISPCALSSFGVTTPTPPKSPKEERKNRRGKQESIVPSQKQQPIRPERPERPERPDSGRTSKDSDSFRSYKGQSKQDYYHNQSLTSSPPPPPRHPSRGASSGKQHQRQYSQLLTDGTSTSPETIHRHLSKHKVRHQSSHGSSKHLVTKQEKGSPPPLRAPGLESESQSSKSSNSASSEKSDRPKHTGHRRQSKAHRDSVSSMDRVQMLEEYNKELHENLLQTVACIENMETDLQCAKTELDSFKEKYRRLQESYSVSQQANSVLEQKLKSAVDSLDSERKFLTQRVVDLTKQLDTAQKTINSLENINVHSLISELLKNHFDSQERRKNFLCPRTSPGQPASDQSDRVQELRNNQPSGGKGDIFEWPQTGQTCAGARQQLATTFLPWKHDNDPWAGLEQLVVKGSDSQLPFPFSDDVPIHKTMEDTKAPSHQMHQVAVNTEIHIVPSNPFIPDEMRLSRETSGEGTITMGKDSDFNYLTAQMMLNEFLNQIPPPAHDDEKKDSLEAVMGGRELAAGKQQHSI